MKGDKWTGIGKEGQGLRDTTEGEGQGDRESARGEGLRDTSEGQGQWDRESDREQGQTEKDRGIAQRDRDRESATGGQGTRTEGTGPEQRDGTGGQGE